MKRRKAREYALQFLYAMDIKDKLNNKNLSYLKDELRFFWDEFKEKDKDIIEFSEGIILGTIENLKEIDKYIISVAQNWKLNRMSAVDRNILRFSTYEIIYRKDIPAAVTMNEAIEIAKQFSASESAAFINGILDKIAKEYQ
ncbi:MAG: transcription antitermination factor NusB [Thermodesulfovibrionales bacterium]|nr:transcription antitermination factor NusB [Thermodesulfovibrionales bacterium]